MHLKELSKLKDDLRLEKRAANLFERSLLYDRIVLSSRDLEGYEIIIF
jgi:hypothetical protein